MLKPNFKELLSGLKLDLSKNQFEKISKATIKYQKKNNIDIIMVTLSDQGVLTSQNGSYTHIPAIPREIKDVSGAGDTVISVAALGILAGLDPGQVAALSNLAGGQVCERAGVVPIDSDRLLDECIQHFKSL